MKTQITVIDDSLVILEMHDHGVNETKICSTQYLSKPGIMRMCFDANIRETELERVTLISRIREWIESYAKYLEEIGKEKERRKKSRKWVVEIHEDGKGIEILVLRECDSDRGIGWYGKDRIVIHQWGTSRPSDDETERLKELAERMATALNDARV